MAEYQCNQESRIQNLENRVKELESYRIDKERQNGGYDSRIQELEGDVCDMRSDLYINKSTLLWVGASVIVGSAVTGAITALITSLINGG